MDVDNALEKEFHNAMLQLYDDAKRLGIYATRFLSEVKSRRGVGAAKYFLSKGDPWEYGQLEGVTQLMLAEGGKANLQYTAEALVLKRKFSSLFTEAERKKACQRLKDLDEFWNCEDE